MPRVLAMSWASDKEKRCLGDGEDVEEEGDDVEEEGGDDVEEEGGDDVEEEGGDDVEEESDFETKGNLEADKFDGSCVVAFESNKLSGLGRKYFPGVQHFLIVLE
jgi:hypothetical protein